MTGLLNPVTLKIGREREKLRGEPNVDGKLISKVIANKIEERVVLIVNAVINSSVQYWKLLAKLRNH